MSGLTNFDTKTLSEPGCCAIIGSKPEEQSALLFDLLESCRGCFSRIYIFTSTEQTAMDFIDEELRDVYFYGSLNPLKNILHRQATGREGRCPKPIAIVFACSIPKTSFACKDMQSLCFHSKRLDIRLIFLGRLFDFPPQLRMNFTEIFFTQDGNLDFLYKIYFQELTREQFHEIFATDNQALVLKTFRPQTMPKLL